jgi:serine/threonine protein kinase
VDRRDGVRPQDKIHRFVIENMIGRGGMGVVYVARDPALDRRIALKVLRPDASSAIEARLIREARAMARVTHPNVVTVHDVGTFGRQVFIAMELVEGETLRTWIRRAPESRSWVESVDLLIEAGDGLAAAHAKGLVHRDFKPDNVLVGNDRRPRVTDFGLARAFVPLEDGSVRRPSGPRVEDTPIDVTLTATNAIAGTPAYMSPEQFLGAPADARSDQFSFCVTLFEALFRSRPFPGRNLGELSSQTISGRYVIPGQLALPDALLAVLKRGLSVDPGMRFGSMEALLSALREVRASGGEAPARVRAKESSARPDRPIRRAMAVGIGILLLSLYTARGSSNDAPGAAPGRVEEAHVPMVMTPPPSKAPDGEELSFDQASVAQQSTAAPESLRPRMASTHRPRAISQNPKPSTRRSAHREHPSPSPTPASTRALPPSPEVSRTMPDDGRLRVFSE